MENTKALLLKHILDADRDQASEVIQTWAETHGYRRSVLELLDPVLDEIGRRWAHTEISLAQGYVAAKVAEDTLLKMVENEGPAGGPETSRGPVVVGNIEDDFHALGRKMVVIFLQAAGWEVCDMGNDVLASEFVEKALEVGACVIGVSAMMDSTALNIRKLRDEIDGRGLTGRIKLAVGGAVFKLRPGLLEEVGGDGTSDTALAAPELFEALWNEATAGEEE